MTNSTLTQDFLKENLEYDLQTGVFKRLKRTTNSLKIGDIAGTLNNKGYSFDNIQIMTWNENKNKYHSDVVRGINNKRSIKVNKFAKNGAFIESYYSIKQAERDTGINNSAICSVCKGKRMTAGGYRWEYA